MSKQSQSSAVYNATINTLNENGISFTDFETKLSDVMTPEMRKTIISIVTEGFTNGSIELRDTPSNQAKLDNPKELNKYVNGLVSNWHRKDKRFNLGNAYEIKNKGSRAGQGDAQLKALKALHKKFLATDPSKAEQIQEAINVRMSELQAEKQAKVVIDVESLPEHLRHLV